MCCSPLENIMFQLDKQLAELERANRKLSRRNALARRALSMGSGSPSLGGSIEC